MISALFRTKSLLVAACVALATPRSLATARSSPRRRWWIARKTTWPN